MNSVLTEEEIAIVDKWERIKCNLIDNHTVMLDDIRMKII